MLTITNLKGNIHSLDNNASGVEANDIQQTLSKCCLNFFKTSK